MVGREKPQYYITAYGLAVKRGFKGTLDEWLASLKGEKGDVGPRGLKGDKGDKGDPAEVLHTDITREEIQAFIRQQVAEAEATLEEKLKSHITDEDNPHGETAEQVGAVAAEAGEEHEGKFLRVVNGVATWVTIVTAEGGDY